MRTRLACWAIVLTVTSTGCPGDTGGSDETSGTTGAADTTTGDAGDGDSTSTTMPGTTDGESTAADSESTAADSESTTGDDASRESSTTAACPAGTEGCPCDGGSCDGGLACVEDVCVTAGACADHPEGEPNDTEATAVDLGEVDGCAVAEVNGAVGAGDVDWFSYHGTHDPTCNQDTSALNDSDPALTTCMYWECDQGQPQVVCFGTPVQFTPDGHPGCCASDGNAVFMQRVCLGVGDQPDGTIYMEVREPDEPMCVEYSLAYLF